MTFPGRVCTSREPEKRAVWLGDAMSSATLTRLPPRDNSSSSIGWMPSKHIRIIVLSETVILSSFVRSTPCCSLATAANWRPPAQS